MTYTVTPGRAIACWQLPQWEALGLLLQERETLLAQLPEGMKHCTIVFKECDKGHGRLTATNWVQHECPHCTIEALREALNVAGGALFRLSPACIEDDEDRIAAEHAHAVGLAAVEHALKRGEQFPGVDIDAVHRKATP